MIAIWMVYALALSLLFGLAAGALEHVASLWARPRRYGWALAISASLLVPLLAVFLPRAPATHTAAPRGPFNRSSVVITTPAGGTLSVGGATSPSSVGPLLARLDRPLLLLWCGASLVFAFGLLRSGVGVRRRARRWRLAVVERTPVLVAPDLGPAVVRLGGFRIVLPQWALSAEPSDRVLMLRHEEEHRTARDPDLLLGATVALVLEPWNLALWWQVHRLQLAVETDCDRRVMRAGADAHTYGGLLLSVGARYARWPLLAATAFSEAPSSLERRIRAMTAPQPSRPIVRAAFATCLAALGVAAACKMPQPAPVASRQPGAGVAALQVYPEESVTERPARLSGPMPRYPELLRSAGISGGVLLEAIIDTSGRAEPASVKVDSSTNAVFAGAAAEAVVGAKFRPGRLDGRLVRVLVRIPVNFQVSPGLLSGITLTAQQQAQVDSIQAILRPQAQALLTGSPLDSTAVGRLDALLTTQRNAIRAVLTPEQQRVFDGNASLMPPLVGPQDGRPGGP